MHPSDAGSIPVDSTRFRDVAQRNKSVCLLSRWPQVRILPSRLRIAECGLRIADCGLGIGESGLPGTESRHTNPQSAIANPQSPGPVAQMYRALGFEPRGCRLESCRAHQIGNFECRIANCEFVSLWRNVDVHILNSTFAQFEIRNSISPV